MQASSHSFYFVILLLHLLLSATVLRIAAEHTPGYGSGASYQRGAAACMQRFAPSSNPGCKVHCAIRPNLGLVGSLDRHQGEVTVWTFSAASACVYRFLLSKRPAPARSHSRYLNKQVVSRIRYTVSRAAAHGRRGTSYATPAKALAPPSRLPLVSTLTVTSDVEALVDV